MDIVLKEIEEEPSKLSRRAGIAALLVLLLVSLPIGAFAGSISGYLEYTYGVFNTKETDVTGTSKTNSSNTNQRYSLMAENNLTNTVKLSAGGTFQKTKSWGDIDGEYTSGTAIRTTPYASLTYANNMISAGGGFNRNKLSTKQSGISNPDRYNDTSNAFLNWTPEDFPTLSLMFTNLDVYDENRTASDTNSKSYFLSSRYKPLKNLDLNYTSMYSDTTNHLLGYESSTLTQSFLTRYNEIFFDSRLALNTGYTFSTQDSELKNWGSSKALTTLVSPIGGLFAVVEPLTGALAPNPDLIIGVTPSKPNGANILLTTSTQPPINANPLNFGMQFNALLNTEEQVGKIRVLVSSTDLTDFSGKEQLLNTSFTWEVYISNNNLDWTPVKPSTQAFTLVDPVTGASSPGFDINFDPLSGNRLQYVKVVTRQVVLNDVNPPPLKNVSVVKLEAYSISIIPPAGSKKTASQTSGVFDLYLRYRLMDLPLLTYDLGFNLSHRDSDTSKFEYRYTVINGLSLSHQFNQVFSSAARLSREDSVEADDSSRSSTVFGVSLSATPLPTLSHTLNFSVRQDNDPSEDKITYSLSNSNSAELYRGVSANLSLSGSMSSDSHDSEQESTTSSFSINLIPHQTLQINASASLNTSSSSGGGKPESSSVTRSGDASISFTPVPAIYLYAQISVIDENDEQLRTAKSFGGAWSPFLGGALQFTTAYSENLTDDSRDSNFQQTIRWNIRPGSTFDIAYLYYDASSTGTSNNSNGITGTLRIRY